MLKWMVPARAPHHPSSSSSQRQQPIPRATEDPLATIDPAALAPDKSTSLKLIASKKRRKQEEVYSVSRTNPLYLEDIMAPGPLTRHDKHERLSIGDRSDPGHSTSSSGYESGNNHEDRRHYRVQLNNAKATPANPASDYRRHLALGRWAVVKSKEPGQVQVVGRAAVQQQNSAYVTKIQMNPAKEAPCDQPGSEITRPIPPPVWPSKAHHAQLADKFEPLAPSALVEQNKNYVTKILIAPRASAEQAGEETFDSIVTDSLLKWTSYGGHEDNGRDPEPTADSANRAEAGAADAVRQLSLTLGKRRAVASVSRAFSKSGSVSSETYAAAGHVSRPPADHAAGFASAIAKRISLTAKRPVEEEVEVTYQRLDQRYVPRNGDANYTASRRADPALNGSAPFSYLAGHHINSLRGNQQWDADRLHDFHHREIPIGDRELLEHDRQSNSSSRSSGSSRRVTFSADTVDNEPSNQSSGSTAVASQESPSGGSSPAPELALDPHYLPYRYHLPGLMGANHQASAENGRLAGYYTHNLKSHSGLYHKQSGPSDAETGKWATYRNEFSKTVPAVPQPDGTAIVKMVEPYQLHPNYAFACQERGPCVDFTLDGGDISLLHRRDVNHKLRRRLCCCLLLLLCFIVLIIVVMGVSLYLSQGEKIFGSA